MCSGLGFSSAPDKYLESEFDLSSGVGFSRPLDKYQESEFDLSSGLGFWRPLDKYRGAPVGYFARLWERVLLIN